MPPAQPAHLGLLVEAVVDEEAVHVGAQQVGALQVAQPQLDLRRRSDKQRDSLILIRADLERTASVRAAEIRPSVAVQ